MIRGSGLALIIRLVLATGASAQTVDPGYEVATWHNFRQAAVSHTFDDNTSNQLAVAVPMFDSFGFKLTLFTVTSWGPDWSGLATAAANGHEIASHTISHQYLNTLSEQEQTNELTGSQDAILANIPNAGALTVAYPYCVRGDDAITNEYYIAARGCSGQIESTTPSDWFNVSSIIVGTEGSVQSGADLIRTANHAAEAGGWAVLLIHGIDNDGGWSPVTSSALRVYLQYLSLSEDKFWVETFGNVVRYIRERDAVSVEEVSADEGIIIVQITDPLDDAVYDYPITLRRELPEEWAAASARQADEPVRHELVEVDSKRYLVFDAIPDAGEVVLAKKTATRTSGEDASPGHSSVIKVYPNPTHSHATFTFELQQAGHVKVEIYDLLGKKLETLVDGVRQPGILQTRWNADGYVPGTYMYRFQGQRTIDVGTLFLMR